MLATSSEHRGSTLRDVQEAAPTIGLQIQILNATTIGEIDAAFSNLARERPDALFVAPDALFVSRRVQLVTLTAHDRIPAVYSTRDPVEAGGLMSYGIDLADFPEVDLLNSNSKVCYGRQCGKQIRF